jgi:Prokaryotic dksA/traR C4-type zinc finger
MTTPNINIIMITLKAKEADASRILQAAMQSLLRKAPTNLTRSRAPVPEKLRFEISTGSPGYFARFGAPFVELTKEHLARVLHCEDEISRRRLEAVPWARLCLLCQEAADRGDYRVLETEHVRLAEAA